LSSVKEIGAAPGASQTLVSAVAVTAIDQSTLLVLDNNRGEVLKVGLQMPGGLTISPLSLASRLSYPFMIRRLGDLIYISDNEGIHIFGPTGTLQQSVVSFYTVYDFVPVRADQIALNPVVRDGAGPLVAMIDATGRKVTAWGQQESGQLGSVRAKANLAACGSTLVLAMVHDPIVYILSDPYTTAVEVQLDFPAEDRLRQMESEAELVNPVPGVYRLPTFLAGVACVHQSVFVALDLPRLCVYEIDLAGRVIRRYLAKDGSPGRHFWRLSALEHETEVRLFSIAADPDGSRKIVESRLPRVTLE
jgi:hypothetical protein